LDSRRVEHLAGHSDEGVHAWAVRESRILLTHDSDFLDDRRFRIDGQPGIVVLPGGSGEMEPLVRALMNMLAVIGRYAEGFEGSKIVFAGDGTLTGRTRQVSSGAVKNLRYRLRKNRVPDVWVDG
jgi:predicted nuclease of predicted toxin-antitoxin system